MNTYRRIEITVGIFVFLGILSMGYMALKLGEVGGLGTTGYIVDASFGDAGGIRPGADVMMAGVVIGRVETVGLKKNRAFLTMRIDNGVRISDDAIALVRTKGIIGDRYIRISQGADTTYLKNGGEIDDTQSAINIEDLISKYIFSPGGK